MGASFPLCSCYSLSKKPIQVATTCYLYVYQQNSRDQVMYQGGIILHLLVNNIIKFEINIANLCRFPKPHINIFKCSLIDGI